MSESKWIEIARTGTFNDSANRPQTFTDADLVQIFSSFGGGEVKSAVSTWEQFGVTLGKIAGGVLEGAARALSWLVEGIRFLGGILGHVIGFVSALCSSLLTNVLFFFLKSRGRTEESDLYSLAD